MPTRSESQSDVLQKHESMLGRPFRRVDQGLDPDDVADYLETVAGSSEAAFQRLEQFSAVRTAAERATEWIAQAKQMAEYARQQTEAEAKAEAARIVESAGREAAEARKRVEEQAKADADRTREEAGQEGTEIRERARDEAHAEAARIVAQAGQTAVSMLEDTAVECLKSTEEAKLSLVALIDEALESSKASIATRIQDTRDRVQQAERDHRKGRTSGPQGASEEPLPAEDADGQGSESGPAGDDQPSASAGQPAEDQDDNPEAREPSGDDSEAADAREPADEDDPSAADTAGHPKRTEDDDQRLYSGELLLEIPQDADALWVRQLRQRMLKLPGLYIQAEQPIEGDDGAVAMHLLLEEPTPLLATLRSMPGLAGVTTSGLSRFEPWRNPESGRKTLKLELDAG